MTVAKRAARPITPLDKSRELQRKLYLAAKWNRNRRFHALYVRLFPPGYDRIFRPDILRQAWEEVRRNGGSAGQDGVTIEEVEREGVEQFLREIEQEWKNLTPYLGSLKSMMNIRRKIHFITESKRLSNPPDEVIKFLNRVIRGLRNYFRIGNCTRKFQQLDRFVRYRLEQWVRPKIGSRGHWNEIAFRASMTEHGLEYFYLHGICAVKP